MGDDWPTDEELDRLQWTTVLYDLHETNPDNGLVRDKTDPGAPSSIAAIGLALASLPVVIERDVLYRPFAAKIARKRLQFLYDLPQGPQPDAAGYKGFFYHFLDIETGRRVWQCEPSTVDSAFLFAGTLTAAAYLDGDSADEAEVRRLADALYRRADWNWARDGGATLTHGWRPETGFLPYRWEGYDEGLLLYVLGLGSPTYPLPPESYAAYCSTYQLKQLYGRELLYSGPLFTHQLSHLWIDFRGLCDAFMRNRRSDYFENSRQATYVQHAYALHNPMQLKDLRTECSCPDYSNPCKHIAAVYYLLGEEFDRDPFLLFRLRGLRREELSKKLTAAGAAAPAAASAETEPAAKPEPLPLDATGFWGTGAVSADVFGEVKRAATAAALPRRLGGFPFWCGQEPFLDALEPIYRAARETGTRTFTGEANVNVPAARRA